MRQEDPFTQLQRNLMFDFEHPHLLEQALTHRSFVNENPLPGVEDNERLEFLGDAILGFISGDLLYARFPEEHEGRLTRLRAALVRKETLAEFARQCGINDALRLGRGEEESGGRNRDTNLCGAFEAVIGALYLDGGLEATTQFMLPVFSDALANIIEMELDKDAKSLLQEKAQQVFSRIPQYKLVDSTGPDHAKEFTVAVYVEDEQLGEGVGSSKQSAGQAAARMALRKMREQAAG